MDSLGISPDVAELYEWTPSYDLPAALASRPTETTGELGLVSKICGLTAGQLGQGKASMLSPLCRPCLSIFGDERPDSALGAPKTRSLKQNFNEMEFSASRGCHLCRVRRTQLSEDDISLLSRTHDIKVGYWESRVGDGIAFQYAMERPGSNPIVNSVALVADKGFGQTTRFSQMRRSENLEAIFTGDAIGDIQSSTNCPANIEVIRHWIQDCVENHVPCKEMRPVSPRLPTRLIDIGQGETIRPVLCSSKNLPPSTLYVTLSHCWGGKEFLRLLKDRLASFQERIPVAELSASFRDAMEVTFRIGIRYIWIDSLCIIQDSEEDWKEQAVLMAEVYRNAYCNLAATAAKDGTHGLFRPRTLLDVEPCRVESQWTGHGRQKYLCHGIGAWQREVEDQPLLSRAWVAQEIILAPRVVHFSRSEIFWECSEKRACESYPDKIPNFTAQKPSLRSRSRARNPWLSINDGLFPRHEVWTDIVDLYSRGDLTYKTKDKLIAISGIARTLGLPAEEYLAGLWKQGLLMQLLWATQKPDKTSQPTPVRASEYRAPSWSWASIDGPVLMKTPTLPGLQHSDVEVLEACTTLVDDRDPFGQVQHGTIRLKGALAFGQLSERIVTHNTRSAIRDGQLVELPLATGSSAQFATHRFLGQAHVNVFLDEQNPQAGAFYYCLLFSQQFGGFGLLITPTGIKRGEFVRRGYFAILTGLYPDSPARFMDLCREFEARTRNNELLYEVKAGVVQHDIQQYIITLV